ncbi:hypothetical protein Cni_G04600 [Canna indica]|uniref:Protein LURP-one-related 8 n=1 Tax=Canna indica TaxID=4628 RepID=A0AAQ3JV26_9LILI|nr:hypothetical protein Cni_G04600 [Canna indica]
MTKVHPNTSSAESARAELGCGGAGVVAEATVLTVWRKSLLFNGNGFTVFDGKGNLVFRVDNYASGSRNEIVLMDVAGKPLLSIRRKKLSLGDHWLIYSGEEVINPRFAVKKCTSLRQSKTLARVTPCVPGAKAFATFVIEGSYSQRSCCVYDNRHQQLAEIKRKESPQGIALGLDVFRLTVEPDLDSSLAMAIVILLEQMFGSR